MALLERLAHPERPLPVLAVLQSLDRRGRWEILELAGG